MLNVLTAMNIISKDKKKITWNGFPHSTLSEERESYENLYKRVDIKREELRYLQSVVRFISVK